MSGYTWNPHWLDALIPTWISQRIGQMLKALEGVKFQPPIDRSFLRALRVLAPRTASSKVVREPDDARRINRHANVRD